MQDGEISKLKQLYDVKDVIREEQNPAMMLKAIDTFDRKLKSVEDELFQTSIAEGDSKSFRDPHKLYSKISVLAGDVNGSVDFAPNKQQRDLHAILKKHMLKQQRMYNELFKNDIPAFNILLKGKNITGLVVPKIK